MNTCYKEETIRTYVDRNRSLSVCGSEGTHNNEDCFKKLKGNIEKLHYIANENRR